MTGVQRDEPPNQCKGGALAVSLVAANPALACTCCIELNYPDLAPSASFFPEGAFTAAANFVGMCTELAQTVARLNIK